MLSAEFSGLEGGMEGQRGDARYHLQTTLARAKRVRGGLLAGHVGGGMISGIRVAAVHGSSSVARQS